MNFRPYTKEDKLEIGTKIRLAGREGEIIEVDEDCYDVAWKDRHDSDLLRLGEFTLLEIADTPVKPLTIDKRVKAETMRLLQKAFDSQDLRPFFIQRVMAYLNSLEEV